MKNKNIGIEYDSYGLTGRNTLNLNKSLKNFGNLEDKSELISTLNLADGTFNLINQVPMHFTINRRPIGNNHFF